MTMPGLQNVGLENGLRGFELAEPERGVWFCLKRHSICTQERARSFPGAENRFYPLILEPRCRLVWLWWLHKESHTAPFAETINLLKADFMVACEIEQQHVVILVRNEVSLPHLDQHNM